MSPARSSRLVDRARTPDGLVLATEHTRTDRYRRVLDVAVDAGLIRVAIYNAPFDDDPTSAPLSHRMVHPCTPPEARHLAEVLMAAAARAEEALGG